MVLGVPHGIPSTIHRLKRGQCPYACDLLLYLLSRTQRHQRNLPTKNEHYTRDRNNQSHPPCASAFQDHSRPMGRNTAPAKSGPTTPTSPSCPMGHTTTADAHALGSRASVSAKKPTLPATIGHVARPAVGAGTTRSRTGCSPGPSPIDADHMIALRGGLRWGSLAEDMTGVARRLALI